MIARAAIATLAIAVVAGCAADEGARLREAARGSPTPFEAARITLHPLTRIVHDESSGDLRIEAHVELTDAWGHETKEVGEFRFELYRAGADLLEEALERQETVWRLDLTDPEANSKQFDRLTRTYTFPLLAAPDWLEAGTRPTLLVQLTTPDGRRLVATRRLERRD